jgi:hypothetical protein
VVRTMPLEEVMAKLEEMGTEQTKRTFIRPGAFCCRQRLSSGRRAYTRIQFAAIRQTETAANSRISTTVKTFLPNF